MEEEWWASDPVDAQATITAAKETEGERVAAGLTTRLTNAKNAIARAVKDDPDADAPGFFEVAAGAFGDEARNFAQPSRRRDVYNAQLDALDAALTLGTGAAYTKEQLANYSATLFPRVTDDGSNIAEKRRRFEELIQSGRIKAGDAAPAIDKAVEASRLLFGDDAAKKEGNRPLAVDVTDTGEGPYSPQGMSVEQLAELERGGFKINQATGMYERPAPPTDESRNSVLGTVDAAVRGIADTVTLGYADEIAAAGQTVFGGGTMAENLARERGIDRQDERVNPYARLGGQIAGGFALPTGAATGARGLARIGALYGAGYGSGSAEGSATDRLIGAAQGGVTGALVGGGLGAIGSRFAGRGGGGGPTGGRGNAVMQAGDALGVQPLAADVGGPLTGRLTAGVAQTVGGAGPVMRGAQRVRQGAGEALNRIATAEGAPVRQEILGETAQRAAQGYIDRSRAAGGAMYQEARNLAGDTRIQGRGAIDALDANLAELSQTASTSAPVISGLQRFRDDLAVTLENGATGRRRLPVDAIRSLRTNIRAEAQTEGLRATDYQRRANQVLDALSEDIAGQLPPAARDAFRQADAAWSERLNVIDDVMSEVIGPQGDRSAERVAQRLQNMSRGDSARLRTFMNNINPEEAGVVRGSLIQELGRSSSGQQNAAGDAFSLSSFLTNYDKLPDRSRQLLFRGDSRQAIENLATLAEGSRNAARFANTSNTGGATNASNMIQNASAIAGWGSAGASLVLENVTARMLASPAFARVLARPPAERGRFIRRAVEAGARDPAIQPDVTRLVQALEASPGRAAAEDNRQ